MGVTVRRAIATALFGIVAVMALKALLTHGASPLEYLTGATRRHGKPRAARRASPTLRRTTSGGVPRETSSGLA